MFPIPLTIIGLLVIIIIITEHPILITTGRPMLLTTEHHPLTTEHPLITEHQHQTFHLLQDQIQWAQVVQGVVVGVHL